jgi:predicted phosphohydrolase
MKSSLRLALTADLHWGSHSRGDAATRLLVDFLKAQPPDVLVLAGDIGTSDHFGACLALFDELVCRKALVAGNHDIWVESDDARGDSLDVYREHLAQACARHGFHYLDQGPLLLPDADLGLAGSINWYDYSWTIERLRSLTPDWQIRLRHKLFSRGRHNDARFVRWPLDDERFTADVVATLERHLQAALAAVEQVLVVTHHPPFLGLSFPRSAEAQASLDGLLWDAFSGNRVLEAVLTRYADRIPFAFCGHTHRGRECTWEAIRGYNIGGDYHFKRLVMLDWPAGSIRARVFGDPGPFRADAS